MPTQEQLEKSKLQRTNPVKLQRFWCMDVPFFAYQLSTGEIVMSKTQFLPNITKTLSQIVLDYISEYNLPTRQGTIPNNHRVPLYPLPTVVEVLKYFHERALLTGQKDLLAALLSGTAILEDSDLLLMTNADLRTRVEPAPSTPPLAKVIKFPIGKLSLSVCIGKNEEIYVSDSEGLSVINVTLSWLIELNPGQKKALILKRNGFPLKKRHFFIKILMMLEPVSSRPKVALGQTGLLFGNISLQKATAKLFRCYGTWQDKASSNGLELYRI